MLISSLSSLPNASGRQGWPWSEESIVKLQNNVSYPKISIITPSFNQGKYLEETIRSIILQNYPNFELIIIDAGSTDETLDIIHKYGQWISYWVSEKDRGQSHAILKGLKKVTGEIVNWINSDDVCAPNAFYAIAKNFDLNSYDVLCGNCYFVNTTIDKIVSRDERMGIGKTVGDTILEQNINQPSAFFRADVMKSLGVDEQFHYAMDLDMWFRYLINRGQERVKLIDDLLTYFRLHGNSKSVSEADKFQNDINKVCYNILLGAKQPAIVLDFVKSIINDFEKFISTPYEINIPPDRLNSLFANYAFRAAHYYYDKGEYSTARRVLKIGLQFDGQEDLRTRYYNLIRILKFPNKIVSALRHIRNFAQV